jgi:hypothetical protein
MNSVVHLRLFTKGLHMTMRAIVILTCCLGLSAQELRPSRYLDGYEKLTSGARDHVEFGIYAKNEAKIGAKNELFIEFYNRNEQDVKLSYRVIDGDLNDAASPIRIAFVAKGGFWPNGLVKPLKGEFKEPKVKIEQVELGVLEQEYEVQMDESGNQSEVLRSKFKSLAQIEIDRKNKGSDQK